MRIDCHVHLGPVNGRARPSTRPGPTIVEFTQHVRKAALDVVWGIYEVTETLCQFAAICSILPVYWVRDPRNPKIPLEAFGVKLHPYRDGWELDVHNVSKTLSRLNEGSVVLIHFDDRSEDTISSARPKLIEPIALRYPNLTFVIGHSGSYAVAVPDSVTEELVREAILIAKSLDNVYLETSVLISDKKAEILAREAPVDKLLIGTDFPIGLKPGSWGYVQEETKLKRFGLYSECLNHNAERVTKLTGWNVSHVG